MRREFFLTLRESLVTSRNFCIIIVSKLFFSLQFRLFQTADKTIAIDAVSTYMAVAPLMIFS